MAQFRRHPPGLVIQFRRYPCRLDTQFERRPTASASCQTCSCQPSQEIQHKYIGLARTIDIGCMYDIFGRKITEYTVIYGVYNTVLATPMCLQQHSCIPLYECRPSYNWQREEAGDVVRPFYNWAREEAGDVFRPFYNWAKGGSRRCSKAFLQLGKGRKHEM